MTQHPAAQDRPWLVAGAGLGGLALMHAWSLHPELQSQPLTLVEQSLTLSEVGAGVQLGPNATRILRQWGLEPALRDLVCQPELIQARNAQGQVVGELPLAQAVEQRYGSPYWCVHRGDLHRVLLQAVQQSVQRGDAQALQLGTTVEAVKALSQSEGSGLQVGLRQQGRELEFVKAQALIAADGVWSAVRRSHWPHSVWKDSDQVAYRTLVPMDQVPPAWRAARVQLWMLPLMHVVAYPIQGGRSLNVVVLLEHQGQGVPMGWDERPQPQWVQHDFEQALSQCPADLRELLACAPEWRVWPLVAAHPLQSPADMAQGAVALLGDAAHPMLPYMAQGAGMALEDAQVLVQLARAHARAGTLKADTLFEHYAQARWARCARVQRKAMRNGHWFHASGVWAWARDLGLRSQAQRIMDVPWLYQGTGADAASG